MEMEIARSAAGVACSKEHQRIYAEWFALADPDSKRQGYLGFPEFVIAMQLVSLAQAGNEITQDSLKSESEDLSIMDPPVMEGVD